MNINHWQLKFLDSNDPTPRRMLGWNIVSWDDDTKSNAVRKWVKGNLQKGTYRMSYSDPECLVQREEDVALLLLRWS